MRHSRMIGVALVFSLATVFVLSSCGLKVKDLDDKNKDLGGFDKPSQAEFQGPVTNFGGTWTGDCAYLTEGSTQTDCSATVTITQMSMLQTETLSFTFKYRLGNREMTNPMPSALYEIKGNTLSERGTETGAIGRSAFSIRDSTFAGLVIRKKNNRQLELMAVRAPAMNFGFDFMAAPSACPSGYCFKALLNRN